MISPKHFNIILLSVIFREIGIIIFGQLINYNYKTLINNYISPLRGFFSFNPFISKNI
jgi:hypothetical protein